MLYSSQHFTIYFGNKHDNLFQAFYLNLPNEPLLSIDPFSKLKKEMHVQQLMFLHQTHSTDGMMVDQEELNTVRPFKQDGDFLITHLLHVGIGIMAGDCIPIIYYDSVENIVAIAHAGWRGSVDGIAVKTLEKMQEEYGSRPKNISIFLGPSAKKCCYEVSPSFKEHLAGFAHTDQVLHERNDKLYFDVPLFNVLQLLAHGIHKEAIHLQYSLCTMCDHQFCSHRREGEKACRQMTVVSLR